jgi:peptide/nickel transport system substrate-binding protein
LPGYDPNVQKSRAEARAIMKKFGYGPDKRLETKRLASPPLDHWP